MYTLHTIILQDDYLIWERLSKYTEENPLLCLELGDFTQV